MIIQKTKDFKSVTQQYFEMEYFENSIYNKHTVII